MKLKKYYTNILAILASAGIAEGSQSGFQTLTTPKPHNKAELLLPRQTQSPTSSTVDFAISPITTSGTAPPSPTDLIEIYAKNPGCSAIDFSQKSCASASPGFSALVASRQATCLCYSNQSWRPQSYDNQVKTCIEFVSIAASNAISIFATLEGFCASVGALTLTGSKPPLQSTVATNTPATTQTNTGQTPTGKPAIYSGGIQNFTQAQLVGTCVGCAVVGILVLYGLWIGCRRRTNHGKDLTEKEATAADNESSGENGSETRKNGRFSETGEIQEVPSRFSMRGGIDIRNHHAHTFS